MKKTIVIIALAALLPALTTFAQPGPGRGRNGGARSGGGPGGEGGQRPPPSPLIMALDANGDGVIDAQEIANAPAALAALDKNGDGKLTPDELRPQGGRGPGGGGGGNNSGNTNSQRGRNNRGGQRNQQQNNAPQGGPAEGPDGQHHAPPLISALDTNGDGTIDANELANASASLLTLDQNGDGQLTFEEFCPHPQGGGGGAQQ